MTERRLNVAIDLVDDLLQAKEDYDKASGQDTLPARDAYGALRSRVIELLDRALRARGEC